MSLTTTSTHMTSPKTDTLSFRVERQDVLRAPREHERRSLGNTVQIMAFEYRNTHGTEVPRSDRPKRARSAK